MVASVRLGLVVGCLLGVCLLCGSSSIAFGVVGGRVYEQVSASYKGGYGATRVEAVAAGGDRVMYYSPGAFGGVPPSGAHPLDYLAERGGSGWVSRSEMAPASLVPYVIGSDVSLSLDSVLSLGKPGPSEEAAFQAGTEEGFLLHATGLPDVAADWELAGGAWFKTVPEEQMILLYKGGSGDLCHLLFHSSTPGRLLPEASVTSSHAPLYPLYELDRGCGGGPAVLRLVGVRNVDGPHGEPAPIAACGVDLGIEGALHGPNAFNAVAAGGGVVFFKSCVETGDPYDVQLFVRLGGVRTLEVSRPLSPSCGEVPCAGAGVRASAAFAGASEDGSRVFFTTRAALEPVTDKDTGEDLYLAGIGCPSVEPECGVSERVVTSLVQVSHALDGERADVQGVVRVASDGERVYFVARGDLLSGSQQVALEGEGRAVPVAGAENLYVYDASTGSMAFIADLCSGSGLSGVVRSAECPTTTGSRDDRLFGEGAEAQTGGVDGRFLVFSSFGRLTRDDTDSARDVYRYDAVTGVLERVSVGEDGADGNGNNSLFDASIQLGHRGGSVQDQFELDSRAVSDDGSRIVFTSAEPLSEAATDGLENAYVWEKLPGWSVGRVSLVSGGGSPEPVSDVVISPEGEDIFFVTSQSLVAGDADSAPDVYDARVERAGDVFPPVPVGRRACSGDACQGPLTSPAPLLIPGSVLQTSGEDVAAVSTSMRSVKAFMPLRVSGKRVYRSRRVKRSRRKHKRGAAHGRGRKQ